MSTRQLEVLRLYRDLLRYSQTLKYTDVNFYLNRVKQEFAKGKTLENEDEIVRQMAVRSQGEARLRCKSSRPVLLHLERSRVSEEQTTDLTESSSDSKHIPAVPYCKKKYSISLR